MSALVSSLPAAGVHPPRNGAPAPAAAAAPAAFGPDVDLAESDPILFWNGVALEANRVSHTIDLGEQTGPPRSARALAIVHLAMYDAYAAVNGGAGGFPAYLPGLPVPVLPPTPDLTLESQAAVAGAAHEALATLFPGQAAFFDLMLDNRGLLPAASVAFGRVVAQQLLAVRVGDPDAAQGTYTYAASPFRHRDDPDNPGKGAHAPFYGRRSAGFAITERHYLAPPPEGDAVYVAALQEVRARGIAPELMGTLGAGAVGRTPNETLRGIYWGYDGAPGLGTPPRLYNQIVRTVAKARGNSPAQNAQLFALVNVAMADAGILAWQWKYEYDFWRPVVGIREHDQSLGPGATVGSSVVAGDCDSGWLPLGAPATNSMGKKNFTPPFPAYPSGHATFGAAALHMLRLFYGVPQGDRGPDQCFTDANGAPLTFISEEFDGVNRDAHGTVRPRHVRAFPRGVWQMIIENGLSRVDLGVHWVFDAFAVTTDEYGRQTPDLTQPIGGVHLGLAIAEDIWQAGLRVSPVLPLAG
jgi:vanadium chloroperoxidase